MKKILLIIFTFIIVLIAYRFMNDNSELLIDSNKLIKSIITPVLEEKIVPGKNIIYCSTLQIAWNKFCNDIMLHNPVKFKNPPWYVNFLNKNMNNKSDLSNDSYYVAAGEGKDNIIAKINIELKQKFPNANDLDIKISENNFIVYSYLYKQLKFFKEFEVLDSPILFGNQFDSNKVSGFGINKFDGDKLEKYEGLMNQVKIWYYDEKYGFIIELIPEKDLDSIFISTLKPLDNLIDTYKNIMTYITKGNSEELGDKDTLQIPKINFDLLHSYKELDNQEILNDGFGGSYLENLSQNIKFKLDEKGAILSSDTTMIGIIKGGAPLTNRKLIVNSPFILFLKQKNADLPYFVLYVDNIEFLEKR